VRELLAHEALERSSVVANSAMNRERGLSGVNSYAKELGFEPLELLRSRLEAGRPAAWLDLCCGRGRALIQAAQALDRGGLADRVLLHGVDLVPMFDPVPAGLPSLRLEAASLFVWSAPQRYDLITCIHGLHYLGDKLELLRRALSWLEPDGCFAASFDLRSLRGADGASLDREVGRRLRAAGVRIDTRRRLVTADGPCAPELPYRYLGADAAAGPNYTGQAAVDSYYELLPVSMGSSIANRS
jgi:SAM-dependent methyltransferase